MKILRRENFVEKGNFFHFHDFYRHFYSRIRDMLGFSLVSFL